MLVWIVQSFDINNLTFFNKCSLVTWNFFIFWMICFWISEIIPWKLKHAGANVISFSCRSSCANFYCLHIGWYLLDVNNLMCLTLFMDGWIILFDLENQGVGCKSMQVVLSLYFFFIRIVSIWRLIILHALGVSEITILLIFFILFNPNCFHCMML